MSRATSKDRKETEAPLTADARQMLFSNAAVDGFIATSTLAGLRTVGGPLEKRMGVHADSQLAKRMRKAKFPAIKSVEGYDFSYLAFPEGYSAHDLKGLGLIDACQNFVFHGKTGRGKTRPAIAVGIAAPMPERPCASTRSPSS